MKNVFIFLTIILSVFSEPLIDLQKKVDDDLSSLKKDYESKRLQVIKKHINNLEKLRDLYTKHREYEKALEVHKALEEINPKAVKMTNTKWKFPNDKLNVLTLLPNGKIHESNKGGSIKQFWAVKDGILHIWPTKQRKVGLFFKFVDDNTLVSDIATLKRVK